jgi:hypothetical protein
VFTLSNDELPSFVIIKEGSALLAAARALQLGTYPVPSCRVPFSRPKRELRFDSLVIKGPDESIQIVKLRAIFWHGELSESKNTDPPDFSARACHNEAAAGESARR